MQSLKVKFGTELRIWEKICIVVGEGREAGIYEARVEDILNGGIVVTEPIFVSGHTFLRNGVVVAVQVTRDDAAYQFYSNIRVRNSPTSKRAHLSPPRGLKRIQRRLFARVEMSAPLLYSRITPDFDWAAWPTGVERLPSSLVNISGGGLLMRVDADLVRNDVLLLSLELLKEAEIPIELLAVCRRVVERNEHRFVGVEFLMTDDLGTHLGTDEVSKVPEQVCRFNNRFQDKLVTFLFHKQIELRRKGLI